MGSFWKKFLFFFLLTIQSFISETISLEDNNPTAYEILRDFNFPTGLLPAGVTAYDFDPLSGKFSAYLNGTCTFTLQGAYKLRYKNTINGYISKGRLARLEGVSVKFIFFWVNVVEVLRKGDELEILNGGCCCRFPYG
ncbi:Nodulin MtN3 family protein [Hibiscus syriacus]|uniref:Nodulin MtN3 family protein n=1 Tax=Hibiscus syriacus TaxID=106335 RepID=A0A6A3CZK7_HIBSY|nr:Nodulin MtN3 family protein [Hibiscus syriacus]